MSRYPFAEIHRLLEEAAAELGSSATIADFRAEATLVDRESELLARARRIVTPHHGIASLFPGRAQMLAWHRPPPRNPAAGNRIAFLGPTIARQRPDIARKLTAGMDEPLIAFGPILESLWDDVEIERRALGPGWLDGIGAILHPATMTHQPRHLLEAVANGVPIYATSTCGLAPDDYMPIGRFRARERAAPLVTSATAS